MDRKRDRGIKRGGRYCFVDGALIGPKVLLISARDGHFVHDRLSLVRNSSWSIFSISSWDGGRGGGSVSTGLYCARSRRCASFCGVGVLEEASIRAWQSGDWLEEGGDETFEVCVHARMNGEWHVALVGILNGNGSEKGSLHCRVCTFLCLV